MEITKKILNDEEVDFMVRYEEDDHDCHANEESGCAVCARYEELKENCI